MVKRIFLLFLAVILVIPAGNSLADLNKLWETTPGQQMLKTYLANVNSFLVNNGEDVINKIFDQTDSVVELGVTMSDDPDDSYMPEHVTATVYMHYQSINYLLLRVDSAERFPKIAAAFLQALNPNTMTQADALKVPTERASRAIKNPSDSFVDVEFDKYADKEKEIMNGEKPQTYYAYYPNQYTNGESWIQLMIIFPMAAYWDMENGVITEENEAANPYVDDMQPDGYEGYFADDYFEHYREYDTPTPEPDSPAGEDDWYY